MVSAQTLILIGDNMEHPHGEDDFARQAMMNKKAKFEQDLDDAVQGFLDDLIDTDLDILDQL